MNNLTIKNDDARPDMDALLGDFFQNEVPKPWPAFQPPMPVRATHSVSFWTRSAGRLALAACVALLVGGYLSLGGFFPRSQTPTGVSREAPDAAKGFDRSKKPLPELPKQMDEDVTPMGTIR